MPKFIVELWLDGYDTEEEMVQACEDYIKEQLNEGTVTLIKEVE